VIQPCRGDVSRSQHCRRSPNAFSVILKSWFSGGARLKLSASNGVRWQQIARRGRLRRTFSRPPIAENSQRISLLLAAQDGDMLPELCRVGSRCGAIAHSASSDGSCALGYTYKKSHWSHRTAPGARVRYLRQDCLTPHPDHEHIPTGLCSLTKPRSKQT
jgi:hypothetical protein